MLPSSHRYVVHFKFLKICAKSELKYFIYMRELGSNIYN